MNEFNNGNGSKSIGFDPFFGPRPVEVFPEVRNSYTPPREYPAEKTPGIVLGLQGPVVPPQCDRKKLFKSLLQDPSKDLPPADCFKGTGFGLYDNPFYYNSYGLDRYNQQSMNDWDQRRRWASQWRSLGVLQVQTGAVWNASPVFEMWRSVDPDLSLSANPEPYYHPGHPLSGNDNSIANALWANNRTALAQNVGQFIQFRSNAPNPQAFVSTIFLDEPESHGVFDSTATQQNFIDNLRFMLYGDASVSSGDCRMHVIIDTYDLRTVQFLVKNFADALIHGCIQIMTDQYYTTNYPLQKRWQFWEDMVREIRKLGGDSPEKVIRPYIAPVCNACGEGSSNYQPDKCCNPEFLIFDVLHAMILGFSGPALYMSNGMPQEFYDYFIVASWLAGCLAPDYTQFPAPWNSRPRNYGELSDLLDDMKGASMAGLDLTQSLKEHISRSNPDFTGEVIENSASCTRHCFINDPVTQTMRLRERGPCCGLPPCRHQPVPACPSDPCVRSWD